jgi:hypothetical protein
VVVRGGGGRGGLGVERRQRGLGRSGRGGADGLEIVAGQHVVGGPFGAAEAAPAAEAVLPVLLLRDGDHQIAEIHAPAVAAAGGRGGGGQAEDLLVHEPRRVHRLGGGWWEVWVGSELDTIGDWAMRPVRVRSTENPGKIVVLG